MIQNIETAGVMEPAKWAAQFISDLSLHILNEDYEALEEIKRRSDEVGGIRATLLVNFGEDSKHNRYGIAIKDEGSTHGLLMKVLEHLAGGVSQADRFSEVVDGIERIEATTDDHEVCRNQIRSLLEQFRAADNGRQAY